MSDTAQSPTASAEAACPHLREVDNRTLRQLFSKVAAVRSENRDLFEFTHRRIDVFRRTAGRAEVVSEHEVYEEFDEDRLKNFAVVIEGEVGTGKSELCAALAHRLRDDDRPLLHVDKEDDLMSLLSDRIPEFYREQFGEEMEGAADFQQLRDDIESIPRVVANSAVSNTILNLNQRGYDVTATENQQDDIRDFIRDKLQLFVESGQYATEVTFVTEQEYRQNGFLQIFTATDVEEAVEIFNEEMWRVVRDRYETASLSEVLKRVGAAFTDTRPVIVFEDFSITSMEAAKLARFIESDSTENTWDFIIAGTRDSTGPLHSRTAEDRYEFYQTNEADSQNVLFLDEESAVDFVRPYLGYFKSLDDSVSYDRDPEAGTFELRAAPSGSRCADCGLCDEQFRDLFPFNEYFLQRIFVGLDEDRKSPREYIMTIFDVLSDYYEGKIDAPSDAKALKPLVNRVSVADAVYEDAEAFSHLARWYGRLNDVNDTIEVDRRFAEAFGLVEPTDDTGNLPGPVETTEDTVIVPSSDIDISPDPPVGDDDDDDDDEVSPPQTDPVDDEFADKAPLLESWLNVPDKFSQTTVYLKRGLEDAIERLTDGYVLYEGTDLEYNLSSQKRPFVFSITEETPDEDQIVIDPAEFRLSDLRSVLRFGIERDMTPRSADYEALLQECGTQLTGYARAWRAKVRRTYLQDSGVLYEKRAQGRYDFADFVLGAYCYVVLLDSPWQRLTAEAVADRFDDGEYAVDEDISPWLRTELEHESYEALSDLVDAGSHLETMVGKLFGVSGSDLDRLKVRRWFKRNSPQDVLASLARTYIDNIDTRVRFGDGTTVQTLANTAYDVRSALGEIDNRYHHDVVEDVASNLDGLSIDAVEQMVLKLDTYDVSPDVMEPLKQFVSLNQSAVDDAATAVAIAADLRLRTSFEALQATLASIKLANSTVYQRYNSVQLQTRDGPGQIGEAFTEVAEHYVE
ncbi:ATP-binding protein [Natrinema caseinilyticum]|uniref:ATP-binding protein n=1 Tax=Natrinema caseinilyticum TaxID=2961570 RepID=UPI0020C3D4BD|nr:ATP-binding protein [Natrinema caseinilyticum]